MKTLLCKILSQKSILLGRRVKIGLLGLGSTNRAALDILIKMQDIADITGYDISTISRVCNSKYVQTEFGVFSLKHFFAESMTNMEGETISNREIKKILSELIAAEDKDNPLNDDALVELLAEQGYKVARRTVAKYRDLLGIPVARLRRNLG